MMGSQHLIQWLNTVSDSSRDKFMWKDAETLKHVIMQCNSENAKSKLSNVETQMPFSTSTSFSIYM